MPNVTLFEHETTAWQASKFANGDPPSLKLQRTGYLVSIQLPAWTALIPNCRGEALEINPLEIFGAEFCRPEIEFHFFDRAPEIFRKYFRIF